MMGALARDSRALCVAATGTGKTETFIGLIKQANVKTVVLVGRDKLVEQTAKRLRAVIPDTAVWSAGQNEKRVAQVTVVSIHSADALTIDGLKLIVCDEAHNFGEEGRYANFINRHHQAKVAGFTATPWRGGVPIYGEGKFFSKVSFKYDIRTAIEAGFLVKPVSKCAPNSFSTEGLKERGGDFILGDLSKLVRDKKKAQAQVEDAMARLKDRKKIVWVCTNIEHAEMIRNLIPEQSCIIHSKQKNNDYHVECFEEKDFRHMVSVMMLSEGYDYPPVDAIVLLRPTKSPTLYVQVVGRGLRPSEGKKDCLVLDYGEVIKNCGPLYDPILQADRKKSEKEPLEKTVKACPECLSYVPHDAEECADCFHEFEKQERDMTKALKQEAGNRDIMAIKQTTERWQPRVVEAYQYTSKKGNNCIRLLFLFSDRMQPFQYYISNHPYSWRKGQKIINALTPWEFSDWQECYNNCEQLVFEVPEWIELKTNDKGFEELKGISDRAQDTNVAVPF